MKQLVACYLLLILSGLATLQGLANPTSAINSRAAVRPIARGLATYYQPTSASLSATPSSLAAFITMVGTASAQQGVSVSGTELTGTVVATAPAGFEVSWTSGANFSTSQILTQSGGTVTNVPLYIRLVGTTLGSFNGNVTLTSPGAATQLVAVSGTVSVISNPNPVAVVTRISPSSGPAGTPVLVHFYGTGFVPGATASITAINGGIFFSVGPATYIDATHLTALVTSSAASVSVRGYAGVTNPAPGGGNGTPASTILYTALPTPPVIISFSPTSGPIGTRVTIVGTNLYVTSGGTAYSSVTSFNGTIAQATTGTGFGSQNSFDVTVPVGATTGLITLTNPNGGAVSAIPFVVTPPHPDFFEDFELGTKTAYSPASVQLQSGGWTFNESLIGTTTGADKFNDTRSARLRGGGFIEMDTDKPNGAGVVTVSAASYSTETGASFLPEISTDGGVTYTSLVGSNPAPTLTSTLTKYSFVANRSGTIRLRFSSTNLTAATNPRLNLDDIGITNFNAPLATRAGANLSTVQVYPNPAHDYVTIAAGLNGPVRVGLYDLLGREVLVSRTLAADKRFVLPPTLPLGTYLLRISSQDEQQAFRLLIE
jgi:hypothetical protein